MIGTNQATLLGLPQDGAGGWTPAELFLAGEKGFWFDITDLSTLFQDAAGTIPVTTDGQFVNYMTDKSGNGPPAIGAADPIYRTSGGTPYLELTALGGFNLSGTTFTADMDHYTTILRDATSVNTLIGSFTGSNFYAACQPGNTSLPHSGAGSPTYIIDGVLLSPANRTTMCNALTKSVIHQLETIGLNLSAWVNYEMLNYQFGFGLIGNCYGSVMRESLTTEEAALLRAYMLSLTS